MSTAPSVQPQSPERDATAGHIEIRNLTKTFGALRAVDDLSFTVEPGRVTGFLGPNGSGKTTTLRMLLGLIKKTGGTATINGQDYHSLARPLETVGAALEATNFHPGRTGRNHLRVLAATHGISDRRVDELLELVGIPAAAKKKAGGYSMGMRQRLGLAAALLGDPHFLVLDEPANGLDPQGIRWLRGFLRHLAHDQGKTVLVSSHMLSEVQQTVDDVVIIANGQSIRQGSITELEGDGGTRVVTRASAPLAEALGQRGATVRVVDDHTVDVDSADTQMIGDTALAAGVPIYALDNTRSSLEELFFQLTEAPENRNRNQEGN